VDSDQQESNKELKLLELALVQSKVAMDNIEKVMLKWVQTRITESMLLSKTSVVKLHQ